MSSVANLERKAPATATAAEDLVLFHRTLAEMCRAQVPLPKALRLVFHDLSRGPLRDATERMARELEEGMDLAESYGNQSPSLPPLYRALIRAGIASGDLPAVLDEIARHAGERARVVARMRQALFYPLVSGIGVVGIAALLLLAVGTSGFLDARAAVRGIGGGGGWYDNAPAIVVAVLSVLVLGFLGVLWFRHPMADGVRTHGFRFRLPFFGQVRLYAVRAGFASTMAMLTGRSVPLSESLELAAAASGDAEVAGRIDAMRARAEGGESLVESVRAGELFSPSMLWFLENGEACGTIPTALADVGAVYQKRFERSVDRMCFFVQPLALVSVGLVVVGFVFAYMVPMYRSFNVFWGN